MSCHLRGAPAVRAKKSFFYLEWGKGGRGRGLVVGRGSEILGVSAVTDDCSCSEGAKAALGGGRGDGDTVVPLTRRPHRRILPGIK